MQQQEKNIKGFNILELLVVIAIVGILSATAFPNIRAWIGDRDVRSAADKIKTLMQNINSQAQRGRYAYVQVFFEDMINAVEGKRHLVVSSNGMKISKLMNMVNDGASAWNAEDGNRGWCNFDDEDYWDDYGETTNTPEVGHYKFEGIAVNFIADAAAVCFSTEGTYYSGNGQFMSELGGEVSIDSVIIICNLIWFFYAPAYRFGIFYNLSFIIISLIPIWLFMIKYDFKFIYTYSKFILIFICLYFVYENISRIDWYLKRYDSWPPIYEEKLLERKNF